MMNKLLRLLFVGTFVFSAVASNAAGNCDGCSGKKALTKEQILGKLPEGILNPTVRGSWKDNENLYLYKGRGADSQVLLYNVKKRTTVPALPVESAAALEIDTLQPVLLGKLKGYLGAETYKKSILKTFSPDNSKIAYIRGNNLYVYSFAEG